MSKVCSVLALRLLVCLYFVAFVKPGLSATKRVRLLKVMVIELLLELFPIETTTFPKVPFIGVEHLISRSTLSKDFPPIRHGTIVEFPVTDHVTPLIVMLSVPAYVLSFPSIGMSSYIGGKSCLVMRKLYVAVSSLYIAVAVTCFVPSAIVSGLKVQVTSSVTSALLPLEYTALTVSPSADGVSPMW